MTSGGPGVASTPACTPPPAWLLRHTKWNDCGSDQPGGRLQRREAIIQVTDDNA